MKTNLNVTKYYNYYFELERAMRKTEHFVTLDKDNYNAFSVRYDWLLQSVCGEIDSILKTLCRLIEPKANVKTISSYYSVIGSYIPTLIDDEVMINQTDITLKPWEKWNANASPTWWRCYNGIKHDRCGETISKNKPNFKFANQQNVLNALSALYLLEQYLVVYSIKDVDLDLGARIMLEVKGDFMTCITWESYYQSFMGQRLFPYGEFIAKLRGDGCKI